jgi:hypothetical protein
MLASLLVSLIGAGFCQCIIPQAILANQEWTKQLIQTLADRHAYTSHILLPDTWVIAETPLPLYAIPTVIVYPNDNQDADTLYLALQHRLPKNTPRVNIIPPRLFLASEHGYFTDRINGLTKDIASLIAFFQDIEEEEYF